LQISPRLASVQHGDYLTARTRLAEGGPETYGSQRYTVEMLERLFADVPHLVVSLDGPEDSQDIGKGRYVTVPSTASRWLPRRFVEMRRTAKILRLLDEFSPTHLILRALDVVGCGVLKWANRRKIPTAVLVASRFDPANPRAIEFCRLANAANVLFVANHNRVATASLLASGLKPDKAIAWDFPPRSTPEQSSVKETPAHGSLKLFYAGTLTESKGVLDAVRAVQAVRQGGIAMSLVICGDGALKAQLSAEPGVREGWLEIAGTVSSERVLDLMRESWAVVVPSRHEFPEALPLVILEALSTRTPLFLSDHPMFREYFVDGRGVRMFRAADVSDLASSLRALASDADSYRRLSQATSEVWHELQIEQRPHELIERFARESGLSTRAY
jgi:glycosyltransferase involved in cell wall biosynthesis